MGELNLDTLIADLDRLRGQLTQLKHDICAARDTIAKVTTLACPRCTSALYCPPHQRILSMLDVWVDGAS